MASKLGPQAIQQLIKGDRSMLMMSDDTILVKQINHAPDGRDVDVKPLLHLVEDILRRSTLTDENISPGTLSHADLVEDKAHQPGFLAMLEALSYTIDRISCEIAYRAFGGSDAHQTTIAIFNMLTNYQWDAKLVLTLAAFAMNYGEFWLLAHIHTSNPLAKSMAILKQLPGIIEHAGPLKPRFDALADLVKVILEVTRCVIEFDDLPSAYISQEVPAYSTGKSHTPTAVYWSIRGIVACATQITSLTTMGYEFIMSTSEAWELSTLAHKLRTILDHFKKQLDSCYKYIEERMDSEAYDMLCDLFKMLHIDNTRVLKALIYSKDDIPPLLDGSTKRRVNLDVLRRKNVLLLISGLDISHDELFILEQIYSEYRTHMLRMEHYYELVWIPFVDRQHTETEWSDALQKQFDNLQSTMPWYSVHHPSLIGTAVIKFIKNEWHYRNKPILVVLDPQGKVVSPNAIHMMWIWGSSAFPFTSLREESLWREESWKLELLVDGIDPMIMNWIKEGRYIILYGTDDIEWARRLTSAAKAVALAERIPLEMIYVGKSSKREQVRRVAATIVAEKLSYCWQEPSMIWFFWTRLESMLFSKIQLKQAEQHDSILQEVKRLLSYDREGGWAVVAKGSDILVNGHGTTVSKTLIEYETLWKDIARAKGFDPALVEYHQKLHIQENPCSRFEFPHAAGRIPDKLMCPECHRQMQIYTTFRCCHEDGIEDYAWNATATATHPPST